jgi:hypothetical protein
MIYDITIRHTEHIRTGDGNQHQFSLLAMEALNEEDAFHRIRFDGIWDGISDIHIHGKSVGSAFSVNTGHAEFPSDAVMPLAGHALMAGSDFEARLG